MKIIVMAQTLKAAPVNTSACLCSSWRVLCFVRVERIEFYLPHINVQNRTKTATLSSSF